ncbi:MAG: BrnT family toxin [Burkholderiaceae bacterium]
MDRLGRVLVVVHTPRGDGVRIISARKASHGEGRYRLSDDDQWRIACGVGAGARCRYAASDRGQAARDPSGRVERGLAIPN